LITVEKKKGREAKDNHGDTERVHNGQVFVQINYFVRFMLFDLDEIVYTTLPFQK
jgi:hypothetical protein